MPPSKQADVRPLDWTRISPREQSHGYCRYFVHCGARATCMRKQGKQGWVPVCRRHSGVPDDEPATGGREGRRPEQENNNASR